MPKKFIINPKDKFGELEIISFHGRKRGELLWKCKCSCEKELIMTTCKLRYRNHCGNKIHKIGKKSKMFQGYEEIHQTFWRTIERGAHKRNLKFTISIKDGWDIYLKQNKLCALTGLPLNFKSEARLYDQTASLDRINPQKGYVFDNVQWVHKDVNIMKRHHTQEKLIYLCKLISLYNNRNCIVEQGPRYTDNRGFIQMIIESHADSSSISVITSTKGSTRASHWHKNDFHYCYLTEGKIAYYERPVGSQDKPKLTIIEPGQLFFSPNYTEHEMVFLEDSSFICFSHLSRNNKNYESDTIRLTQKLKDIYEQL